MKNNKKAAAMFAILSVLSGLGMGMAYAGEKAFNFDGRSGSGFFSAEDFKAELAAAKAPQASQPVEADRSVTLKIKAVVKNGKQVKEETLACRPGRGQDKIADCKKSDASVLTYEDLNTLALRPYFSAETLKFADLLNQSKHSYTNQSGPMTFHCEDSCANWELVEIHFHADWGGVGDNHFERKCVEWTHECECTAGC